MDRTFDALLETVRSRRALALVGAGSSARVGYPLWDQLLERLERECVRRGCPERGPLAKPEDTLRRAEECRRILGPECFYRLIHETFGPPDAPFHEFHVDLVRVPFRHVLTTNFDAVLERAHERAFGRPAEWFDHRDAAAVEALAERLAGPNGDRRYVHLHGRFDDPEGVVLTERDYEEIRSAAVWPRLFALIAANPVVCVGFSLADVNLMALFRRVRAVMGEGSPRHFALVPRGENGHARALIERYGIEPVFYENGGDHAELHHLVRELSDGND